MFFVYTKTPHIGAQIKQEPGTRNYSATSPADIKPYNNVLSEF